MKNLFLIAALFLASNFIFAQEKRKFTPVTEAEQESLKKKIKDVPETDNELLTFDIIRFCNYFEIPSDFNSRYEAIVVPLCNAKIYLFDSTTNLNCAGESNCYCYVGSDKQNMIFKKNILANRNLLQNGHLAAEDAKRWKVIK